MKLHESPENVMGHPAVEGARESLGMEDVDVGVSDLARPQGRGDAAPALGMHVEGAGAEAVSVAENADEEELEGVQGGVDGEARHGRDEELQRDVALVLVHELDEVDEGADPVRAAKLEAPVVRQVKEQPDRGARLWQLNHPLPAAARDHVAERLAACQFEAGGGTHDQACSWYVSTVKVWLSHEMTLKSPD